MTCFVPVHGRLGAGQGAYRWSARAGRRPWSRLVSTLALVAVMATPLAALAAPLDLSLRGFYDPNRPPAEATRNGAYSALMSEMALLLGSKMVGPAQSLGALGMEAALEMSFGQTNSTADYWKNSVAKPSATVTTAQMRVRKGLPYAMQVGAVLTHLMDSNMWAIGAELNMSLVDGYVSVPDLGLRTSVQSVLGHSDISMLIVGADLVLSKSFGIGGVVSLQPWGAYSFSYSNVTTRQIEVYPNDTTLEPDLMLLKAVNNVSHRAAFGLRLVVTRISIGGEFLRSFTDGLGVFTGKIALDF